MALTIRATEEMLLGALSPLGQFAMLSYLGIVKRRDPINGETFILTYESPASNDPTIASPAESAYNLIPPGFTAELVAIGPVYRLTVSTTEDPSGGTTAPPTSQYELLGNANQLDIREHPLALALLPEAIEEIDDALNANRADRPALISDFTGDQLILYKLLLQRRGNMGFQVPQYVFRWTQICGNLANVTPPYQNVPKIYTTAQMIAETGPPVGILNSIESAVSNSTPTATDGYTYGWLKQSPTVVTVANNKIQISGEFWLAQWSTWVYATA